STNAVPGLAGTTNPQRDQGVGNETQPTIVIDPQNSQNMVSVFTRNQTGGDSSFFAEPNTNTGPQVPIYVRASYSTNGRVTWNAVRLPNQGRTDFSQDQTSGPKFFAQITDPSVAFDGQHNFYITYEAHTPTFNAGEILLQKYDFSGTAPTRTITDKR